MPSPVPPTADELAAAFLTDDAVRMARALLAHARLQVAARVSPETPLAILRRGDLPGALRIADGHDLDRLPLWHVLLAWELADTDRAADARAVLANLSGHDLWQFYFGQWSWVPVLGAYLIAHVAAVDPHDVSDACALVARAYPEQTEAIARAVREAEPV